MSEENPELDYQIICERDPLDLARELQAHFEMDESLVRKMRWQLYGPPMTIFRDGYPMFAQCIIRQRSEPVHRGYMIGRWG